MYEKFVLSLLSPGTHLRMKVMARVRERTLSSIRPSAKPGATTRTTKKEESIHLLNQQYNRIILLLSLYQILVTFCKSIGFGVFDFPKVNVGKNLQTDFLA